MKAGEFPSVRKAAIEAGITRGELGGAGLATNPPKCLATYLTTVIVFGGTPGSSPVAQENLPITLEIT
jgi:hypothetical protein